MSGPTGAAVKAALMTLFTAALPTAQVQYGPAGVTSAQDRVRVGNIRSRVDPIVLGPNRKHEERYAVECIISCGRLGSPETRQRVATEAAYALYSAAALALLGSANTTLGVTGVLWALPTGPEALTEERAYDGSSGQQVVIGSVATLTFAVEIVARFSL